MIVYLDYNNKECDKEAAVAKYISKDDNNKYYIKRTAYGHFFNDAKIMHEKALRRSTDKPYEFIQVSEDVFLSYLGFLKTKNQVRANQTERLYNEEGSQRIR